MIFFRVIQIISLISIASRFSLAENYNNVYGQELRSCSSDGMALTGYTRTGYCVDRNDDAGSHHICIDLSSANGGNFCTVTGQSDWCDSENMPCHEDTNDYSCAIQHWCVCQWAFATYLEKAGGCDQIQDIVCQAINEQAIFAYQDKGTQGNRYSDALACLVNRCGLDESILTSQSSFFRSRPIQSWLAIFLMTAALLAVAVVTFRKTSSMSHLQHKLVQEQSREGVM